MHRGYVKLWRKSLDSGLMGNCEAWAVWTYILLQASHKKRKQLVGPSIVNLSPGQLVVGRKVLAERLGLTERKIRTCLSLLEKLENVTIETTNRYSLITVINWELYQQGDQQTTSRATSTRPALDQHSTTNKNERMREEENPPKPPQGEQGEEQPEKPKKKPRQKKIDKPIEYTDAFNHFYDLYPSKKGKAKAFECWQRLDIDTQRIAYKALKAQVESHHFRNLKGNDVYPHLSTWLNGRRWEDEVGVQDPEDRDPTPEEMRAQWLKFSPELKRSVLDEYAHVLTDEDKQLAKVGG